MLGVLLAAQGLVGSVQYELHLPTDMVWVHVSLATITWLVAAVGGGGGRAAGAAPVAVGAASASCPTTSGVAPLS